MKTIYLAGGCFWGMEQLYRTLPGVTEVTAGYANGSDPARANYPAVCTGTTGFREAIRVDYDPVRISLEHLLFAFFAVIDPETPEQQGPDIGSQYQTGIYWTDPADEPVIHALSDLEAAPLSYFAVETEPLKSFYPAEEFHQRYLEKNPAGYCHIGSWRIAALSRYPFCREAYARPAADLLREWWNQQECS